MNFSSISEAPNFTSTTQSHYANKTKKLLFNNNKMDILEFFVDSNLNKTSPKVKAGYGKNASLAIIDNLHKPKQRPLATRSFGGSAEDITNQFATTENAKNKSRMPDIQMINKYYGLVPKKFTVHSRQQYTDRKLRSKSAFTCKSKSNLTKSSSLDEPLNSCSSDGESNELVKRNKKNKEVVSGKCVMKDKALLSAKTPTSQPTTNESLQTRKISVERQNKLLKHRGRSSSLPISKELDYFTNYTASVQRENAAQRVIKIDLNNMSWEEASCSSPCPSLASQSDDNEKLNGFSEDNDYFIKALEEKVGDNEKSTQSKEKTIQSTSHAHQCNSISSAKVETIFSTNNDEIDAGGLLGSGNNVNGQNLASLSGEQLDGINESWSVLGESQIEMVNSSETSNKRGRLKKTISFDEQILSSLEADKSKPKRPMTASIMATNISPKQSVSSSLIQTKDKLAQEKVLPWTQKAGKGMTLAERRSKLQKTVSIHSTDSSNSTTTTSMTNTNSTSIDIFMGEECSDSEIMSNYSMPPTPQPFLPMTPGPNSSAYKESRKPLYFKPPAEVSTLISQIEPLETLDIQVEIEKVAVILNNMTTQNKSFIDLTPEGAVKKELEPKQSQEQDANGNLTKFVPITHNRTLFSPYRNPGEMLCIKSPSPDSSSSSATFPSRTNYTLGTNGVKEFVPNNNKNEGHEITSAGLYCKTQTLSPPAKARPLLKKAVSLCCEKELDGNEVKLNGLSHNENKSSRPKTAAASSSSVVPGPTKTSLLRTSSTPSIVTKSGRNSSPIRSLSRTSNCSKDQSQGQNSSRKHLIKKALIEINQSFPKQFGAKKWGTLGRPKTAPNSSDRKNQQKRQPLKTSPAPLVMAGNNNKSGSGRGTKATSTPNMGKKHAPLGKHVSTNSILSLPPKSSSEAEDEEKEGKIEKTPVNPRRTLHRQSFSLDEGMLLGFSNKEFGWDSEDKSSENLFQSSRKREECLKIYEKMLKTGNNVKLDTIFRGMMTPSEYRGFIRAAEDAAREFAASEEEKKAEIADAGVKSSVEQDQTIPVQ